jgi:hypothetical protein
MYNNKLIELCTLLIEQRCQSVKKPGPVLCVNFKIRSVNKVGQNFVIYIFRRFLESPPQIAETYD